VRGKALIEWHLEALARGGVHRVVVNTAWLEEQFPPALGDGSRWGLELHYSMEGRDHGGALETAGGIAKALPWLGEVFWVVSGDVFLPRFAFDAGLVEGFAASDALAQLWLAPNAPHHPEGDFAIDAQGQVVMNAQPRRTWASVGLFRSAMFSGIVPGTRLPLRPLLDAAAQTRRLRGVAWDQGWTDIGTAERLAQVDRAP
jgi:MurNAc alpha-1-phosphate uridylyltransferase